MPKKRSKNPADETSKRKKKQTEHLDEVPDRHSAEFYEDEVEQFHSEREKIPLDTRFAGQDDESASEEEVLAVESDDSDNDSDDNLESEMAANLSRLQRNLTNEELASDIEDADEGLPDSQAWGKMRHKYYGADVQDDEDLDSEGSELGAAELEEQEAMAIQKRLAQQLDDQDFGFDSFKPTAKVIGEKEEIVVTKDLSKLTRREKLQLLKQEAPEFLDLIEDYKVKMREAADRLYPVVKKMRTGDVPPGPAADYVNTKFRIIFSYCVNVSFYLMLKTRHEPVHHHPVINRIVQYRGLLQQLEAADDVIQSSLDELLQKIKDGVPLNTTEDPRNKSLRSSETVKEAKEKRKQKDVNVKGKRKKISELLDDNSEDEDINIDNKKRKLDQPSSTKRLKTTNSRFETKDEKEALEYYKMMKAGRRQEAEVENASSDEELKELRDSERKERAASSSEGEDDLAGYDERDDEDQVVGKRGITKQIEKNRGLTPHRNKDNKNPRVKHRKKFRKAKIRRRGAVREYRPETTRYGGELSGIRAGVKKSIKLK